MKRFSFVILNYHTSEDTIKCIDSIVDIKQPDTDISVVIIDNGSKEEEIQVLREYIKQNRGVRCKLLEMHENLGFSKGNNYGFKYVKEAYSPDFIIVSNSDIIIKQKDFFSSIIDIYNEEAFSLLGPDVYVPRKKLHQNPVLGRLVDDRQFVQNEIEKCRKKIQVLQKLKNKGMKKAIIDGRGVFWAKNYVKNAISVILHKGYRCQYIGECIHGSFLICGKPFIEKYDKCFEPEVFLYGEEDLLLHKCLMNNDKVVYSPRIKVLHYSGGTGKMKSDADIDRQLFYWKNELESKKVLLSQFK